MGRSWAGGRGSTLHLTRIFNPKGIVSSSPGLRGTSYPGKSRERLSNPERVVAGAPHNVRARNATTLSGLERAAICRPRVARSSQPLGFVAESLWDSSWDADSKYP